MKKLTEADVVHVAKLAKLALTATEVKKFQQQLSLVLEYMSRIQKLDTNNIPETAQITGLENVFREDKIDKKRMLTQEQALANAKRKQNGYFVVKAIFGE